MILQALDRCYELMEAAGSFQLARPGYSSRDCSFVLLIDAEGRCKAVIDLRDGKRGETHIVPLQLGRSGKNPPPYFLCENAKYFLGCSYDKETNSLLDCKKNLVAAMELHQHILQNSEDIAAKAVLRFFARRLAGEELAVDIDKSDDIYKSGFILFKLEGMQGYINDSLTIKQAWEEYNRKQAGNEKDVVLGQCMISGERNVPLARIHTLLKGVMGAKATGGSLVGFNFPAVESYGKKQSYNAPVSEMSMFKYTTAVNMLLSQSDNRVILGDMTCVFWTEHEIKGNIVNMITDFLGGGQEQSGKIELGNVNNVPAKAILLRALYGNKLTTEMLVQEKDTTVYILGLAPNAARLSLRFWYQDTFGNLADNLIRHYRDMEIVKSDAIRHFASMYDIIRSIAIAGKMENAPKTMLTGLFDAVTKGLLYPQGVYTNILLRIRAETGDDFGINYTRCAFIKAFLIRNSKEEVTVGLNEESNNTGYNLGRVFAILERIQELAGNKNLRERYFVSASTNPITVFPNVIRLSQSHIIKIGKDKPGLAVYFDKLCGEVLAKLDEFPMNLNMDEQGMFVLGYYHQKQIKKADAAE